MRSALGSATVMEGQQMRTIVQQLHDLCADKENRANIVKDNSCLPGLTLFLDNPDPEVVHLALETLLLLSEEEGNRAKMYSDINFVKPIKNVLENPKLPPRSKATACKLFWNIQPQQTPLVRPTPGTPVPTGSASLESQPPTSSVPFLSASARASRHIRLQLAGLEDPTLRKGVQEALLSVKGLVSFTFDLKAEQVNIRALENVSPVTFARAVANGTGTKVMVVVMEPDGEEKLVDVINEEPD